MDVYAVIGIVLGLVGLKFLWDVPRDVRQHDRKVRNRSDDLAGWIDDADGDLSNELTKLGLRHARATWTQNNQVQQVQWPLYLRVYQKQSAKDEVVKRLGDQVREANRYREEIELDEQLSHRLWRRMPWARPLPELTALEETTETIARWKEPVTQDEVKHDQDRAGLIGKLAQRRSTPTGPFGPGQG
jgi:hypothetical protein